MGWDRVGHLRAVLALEFTENQRKMPSPWKGEGDMRQSIIKAFCRAHDQEKGEGSTALYRCTEVLTGKGTD